MSKKVHFVLPSPDAVSENVMDPVDPVDEDYGRGDKEHERDLSYPQILIKQSDGYTAIAILQEGDTHSCAGSSKPDRRHRGPCIVYTSANIDGTFQHVLSMDNPKTWWYVNCLCNIGAAACRNEDGVSFKKDFEESTLEYIQKNTSEEE